MTPLVVPPSTVRFFPAGTSCVDARPGDLVLTADSGFLAKGIQFFERLRLGHEWSWTNHAAIVVGSGPQALVSQMAASGDILTPISQLNATLYAVVSIEMTDVQRGDVVQFATLSVGTTGYGYLQIPADAFNAMSGLELSLGWGNRMVCSTQACRALERAGLIPDRSPYAVTPAHLAQYFGAPRPA
jgi:hypothetical protein